jgi:hypothetical protein
MNPAKNGLSCLKECLFAGQGEEYYFITKSAILVVHFQELSSLGQQIAIQSASICILLTDFRN